VRVATTAVLALLCAVAILTRADAAEHDVSLGEVSTRVVRTDVDLEAILRSSLSHALGNFDVRQAAPGRRIVISGALQGIDVDLATRSAVCAVSLALRHARGGSMFAVVEGRAQVALDSRRPLGVERRAIDAAVQAALARVPEALR
jgi:hypothetical protein